MIGATEFAKLFSTGQYGRLYLVSGQHARGRTFQIYVLPKDEEAIPNGPGNPPLNTDAVEVFGITGGQPGWTETYGWLHKGKWQDDFARLCDQRKNEIKAASQRQDRAIRQNKANKFDRTARLLSDY